MVGRTLEQIGRRRGWLVEHNHIDDSPRFTVKLCSTMEVLEVMKRMDRWIEVDIIIRHWTSHFQCGIDDISLFCMLFDPNFLCA